MPSHTDVHKTMKDKHVADLFDGRGEIGQTLRESTQIVGPLKGITMSIQHGEDSFDIPMATLQHLDLAVAVPEEKIVNGWEIQAKVDIKLSNLELISNIGNLVKLSFVFEDNSDEMSPFIKGAKKWYKKVDMRIGVKEGALNIHSLKTENKNQP